MSLDSSALMSRRFCINVTDVSVLLCGTNLLLQFGTGSRGGNVSLTPPLPPPLVQFKVSLHPRSITVIRDSSAVVLI